MSQHRFIKPKFHYRMKPEYIIGAVILLLGALGLAWLFGGSSEDMKDIARNLGKGNERYKEIVNPSGFVNTDQITIGELVGTKVVLVDFMTYSCINCQRTFPYLVAWYEKYKEQGLEIVGIHTPEFAFEKDINNVRAAMAKFGIKYPVVLDNEYATWGAYGNRYWPRKYLIDIHGDIVYDHIGEGAYEATEMKIRELLKERASVVDESAASDMGGFAASNVPVVSIEAQSPETYFGAARNEYLANGIQHRRGEQQFAKSDSPARNLLYLGGTWNITDEYAEAISDASVVYRFRAKQVYLVAEADAPSSVEVRVDGEPVGAGGGSDVVQGQRFMVDESRLYHVIDADSPGEHVLELRVAPGVRFFAFTFG